MTYKYSESELKKIMKNFVIIVDSREKANDHVTSYFKQHKKSFEIQKVDTGDYACYIRKIPELGIIRDIHIPAKVERKAHWSEIAGNLQKATQKAFENELIRSQGAPFTILIEDADGYGNLLNENYNSNYKALSLLGRMNSFKAKFNFEMVYLDPKYTGNWIWFHLYYQALQYLKTMDIQIYIPQPSE